MNLTPTNAEVLSLGFYGPTKANFRLDKICNVTVTRHKR